MTKIHLPSSENSIQIIGITFKPHAVKLVMFNDNNMIRSGHNPLIRATGVYRLAFSRYLKSCKSEPCTANDIMSS